MTERNEADLSALRVLIVDDDEMVRNLLEIMLQRMGVYQTISVATAQAALEAVVIRSIDIAIVDWQLDDMEGGELILALRQVTKQNPERFGIFLLTGFPLADRITAANRAGANEFLVKPVQSENLRRCIEHFMLQFRSASKRTDNRIANWRRASS